MPKNIPITFPITTIAIPSSSYMKGRAGWVPDMIVIHATEGNRASVIQTFKSVGVQKSTHFMVCKTGEIVQFVGTADTAFGNGIMISPTNSVVVSRKTNPNFYTISIEHELLKYESPTQAQYDASATLLKFLSSKWGIPLDTKHVIPHKVINGAKTCPNNVDIQHLLDLAVDK